MPALRDILFGRNTESKSRRQPEGKVGLALSGGGFRAAFFHIGVLARLAELEILPRVEVISTVSGGSIVGALYYVCLKQRLEAMPDSGIGKAGYLELVGEVEERLRRGTQKNIRSRVFANPVKNAAMVMLPHYSRSDRIGDLYDRYIYKEAWEEAWGSRPRKWGGYGPEKQIELRDLPIAPRHQKVDPPHYNEHHDEKLPILLLNATSLNSGHNWRFEAVRMGESLPEDDRRTQIVKEVDKNMRLEPGYFEYREKKTPVPEKQRDFPLALAVAASAAVPGVFQPLAISGMYEGIRVQLVDGGVQDNQGVQGLFDTDCEQLIVSDASGQMEDKESPSSRLLGVLGRSPSIEGDRIRDEQLLEALEGEHERCALMHLRKGIDGAVIAPGKPLEGAPKDPKRTSDYGSSAFGVHRDVQEALSRIRTDLDFFGDVEASSLELDGYLMSGFELKRSQFATEEELDAGEAGGWAFRDDKLEAELGLEESPALRQLEAGKNKFFRGFKLHPVLATVVRIAVAVALAAAIYAARNDIGDLLDARWCAGAVLAVTVLALLFGAFYAADPHSKALRLVLSVPMFLLSLPLALLAAIAAIPIYASVSLSELARKLR